MARCNICRKYVEGDLDEHLRKSHVQDSGIMSKANYIVIGAILGALPGIVLTLKLVDVISGNSDAGLAGLYFGLTVPIALVGAAIGGPIGYAYAPSQGRLRYSNCP